MSNEINIKEIRKGLGLTQAQLAARMGVNVATVARYEQKGLPKGGTARALLERLAEECA